MAGYEGVSAAVYGEEQRADVQRQLDRLLENPHFSHSKRFPSFLRYIIQEELEGRGDRLKERTLGIEVFGRDAGYDTTSDPIVRVTAAEIRKRIAQYYQGAGGPDELRISLPPGSYVPQFEWPRSADAAAQQLPDWPSPWWPVLLDEALVSAPERDALSVENPMHKARARLHAAWLVMASALVIVSVAGGWFWMSSRPTMLDRFWAPVFGTGDPRSAGFPQSSFSGQTLRDASSPTEKRHLDEQMRGVVLDDLQPLMSLSWSSGDATTALHAAG